ncbi:MAG: ribosomal L7Ae/L30e/S12e/Gadd45 family protein [Clostridiales bacterium]|jgi:large subunit ribosomal protein L7A|nr:ribosomal L7Ae/L30e/S12e/Gadd45 family protein [Clostridiales bacterium]
MSGIDLESALSGRKVVGTKQVLRALSEDGLSFVILAEDADKGVIDKILRAASERRTDVSFTPSKTELGRAAGIEVAAAAVGILK